jgi:ubiquinone/menaquinone biosynthesis C-methylase UbiE
MCRASVPAEVEHMQNDPYAKFAARYDRLTGSFPVRFRMGGVAIFPPRENLKILDVGCGTGEMLVTYAKPGCELVGLDRSPSMLDVARQKLGASARLLLEDATHMSFANGTFDLVTCMLALHEMQAEDRLLVLRECRRVTKPGGHILLIDFHCGPYSFPQGWLYKLLMVFAEMRAGKVHFAHYREFMAHRGLDGLLEGSGITVERRLVFSSGIVAIFLLKA